jgi:hypothetical protein
MHELYFIGFQSQISELRGCLHKLLYGMRYQQPAINHQIEDRFKRFLIELLKEYALILLSAKYNIETCELIKTSKFNFRFMDMLREFQSSPEKFSKIMNDTKDELTHIVYTHIISKGVFPFSLELCTQNIRVAQNWCANYIVPEEISPWGYKYHSSFIIGNFRYSFTPNDIFNLTLSDEREYSDSLGVN